MVGPGPKRDTVSSRTIDRMDQTPRPASRKTPEAGTASPPPLARRRRLIRIVGLAQYEGIPGAH